jgi:hypothetical protein
VWICAAQLESSLAKALAQNELANQLDDNILHQLSRPLISIASYASRVFSSKALTAPAASARSLTTRKRNSVRVTPTNSAQFNSGKWSDSALPLERQARVSFRMDDADMRADDASVASGTSAVARSVQSAASMAGRSLGALKSAGSFFSGSSFNSRAALKKEGQVRPIAERDVRACLTLTQLPASSPSILFRAQTHTWTHGRCGVAPAQSAFPLWLWFLNFKLQVHFFFLVYESVNLWGFVFTNEVPWDSRVPEYIRKYSLVEVEGAGFQRYAMVVMGVFIVLYLFLLVDALLVRAWRAASLFRIPRCGLGGFRSVGASVQSQGHAHHQPVSPPHTRKPRECSSLSALSALGWVDHRLGLRCRCRRRRRSASPSSSSC